MNNRFSQAAALLALFLMTACGSQVNSPQGFRLPKGDPDAGRQAFVAVGCMQCHTVFKDSLPEPEMPRALTVQLGGEVPRVKTYAQLVTSIIYPSHATTDSNAVSQSPMPDLTENLTVRQLVDITQYLQPKYKVVLPDYSHDGMYHP
ncbi:c-type cytochrome [Pelagicoccus sp. SDUM812005]|uniref:c-type cytochrome n=1 Tax=Pelagicoccus sp. SDUM812005 TaxID=3041257 RepID=UPI00280D5F18|nr:c-type cytochrome [Pelagicoccus sp. SDUM812005]MDQ8182638.1 hypothetical protein [Pelagicoccus sp. SDUM812005]